MPTNCNKPLHCRTEKQTKSLEAIVDIYKSKANDLQKVYIIIMGLGLFFFIMILFPYFSLKYDSMSNSKIEWLTGDISQIVTSVDNILNESQAITNNLQAYTNTKVQQ